MKKLILISALMFSFNSWALSDYRPYDETANANDENIPNRRFIVLVDGSYWTDERIEELREFITANNVFVSRVVDLTGYITQL